jgi:hypothetical protein
LLRGGRPTRESIVEDETNSLNQLAQQAIERLQDAKSRRARLRA